MQASFLPVYLLCKLKRKIKNKQTNQPNLTTKQTKKKYNNHQKEQNKQTKPRQTCSFAYKYQNSQTWKFRECLQKSQYFYKIYHKLDGSCDTLTVFREVLPLGIKIAISYAM